jgi:FG-GAP-like repeat
MERCLVLALLLAFTAQNSDASDWNNSGKSRSGSEKVYLELPGLETQGSGVGKDFNNDGQADLIWENVDDGRRLIWIMHNGLRTSQTIELPTLDSSWHIAAVGDFLGNGQSDIVWEDDGNGQREIWLMNNGVRTGTIDFYASAPWHIAGRIHNF